MPAPHITPLPTPPSRSQSPDTFSTDADAFLGALPEFQTDANTQADYLDGLADQVTLDAASANAAAAVATGAANYQGDYIAIVTYQIGESVSYNGRRYVAKTVNTGITPADGANWFLINDGDVLGPISATNNELVVFDGTTGKFIKGGIGNGALGALLASGGLGNAPAYLEQGTIGQILTSAGAGAPPVWQNPATGGSLLRTVVFTASGDWSKGAGTKYIKVRGVGGGGSGSGAGAVSVYASGGSAGGYFEKFIDVSSVSSVPVTIGAGGLGQVNNVGLPGGDTSFGSYAIGYGGGGANTSTAIPNDGGIAVGGDINIQGGRGTTGNNTSIGIFRGEGGNSQLGAGGSVPRGIKSNGTNGLGYGSGGSGAKSDGATPYVSGGNGAPGIVIVEEYA